MDEFAGRLALAPREVAPLLGLTDAGVRARIRRGNIPAHRVGRDLRVPIDWVRQFATIAK